MTEPPETNLTDKFVTLSTLLTTQHTALMAKLDAVIAAINSIEPADNTSITSISNVLGTRADCTTGESILGVLCRLADGIVGTSGPGAPPEICPGYESFQYFYSSSWVQYYGGLPPEPQDYYNSTFSAPVGTALSLISRDNNNGQMYNRVQVGLPAANFCVTFVRPDTGYTIWIYVRDIDENLRYTVPLTDAEGAPEQGSHIVQTIDAGDTVELVATALLGGPFDPPQAQIWITQGAFG